LPLSKLTGCVIIVLLSVSLGSLAVSDVHAQSVTIITTGQPVGSVSTGSNIHLSFSVSWANLHVGWFLLVPLIDLQTSSVVTSATATGSPAQCVRLLTGDQTPGRCGFQLQQSSGVESVGFDFSAPSNAQTLRLVAGSVVYSTCCDKSNMTMTNFSPTLSVMIVSQAISQVYTTTTTYSPQIIIEWYQTIATTSSLVTTTVAEAQVKAVPLIPDYSTESNYNPSNGSFTLESVGKFSRRVPNIQANNAVSCVIYQFRLNADANAMVHIPNVTGSDWFRFYLLNSAGFQQWNWSSCDISPTLQSQPYVKSFGLDWIAPVKDTYYFLFENHRDSDIQINGFLPTIVEAVNVTTTYTTYLAQSNVGLNYRSLGLASILIIVLGIILTFVVLRRSGARKKGTARITRKGIGTSFCINCELKLPPNSQFCNNCGTKQS